MAVRQCLTGYTRHAGRPSNDRDCRRAGHTAGRAAARGARAILPRSFLLRAGRPSTGHIPSEGVLQAVRRYELMLVLRPDAPDERASAVIDRTTRYVVASGGQIVKVAPWGRRRLAHPIHRSPAGADHLIVFESPSEAIAELERSLQITEDVLRYLVTRVVRPVKARRDAAAGEPEETASPSGGDGEEEDEGE